MTYLEFSQSFLMKAKYLIKLFLFNTQIFLISIQIYVLLEYVEKFANNMLKLTSFK